MQSNMAATQVAPETFSSKLVINGGGDTLRVIDWSAKGTELATGSYEGTLTVWNPLSGTIRKSRRLHEDSISCLSWSFDGALIASATIDRAFRIWNLASDKSYSIPEAAALRPFSVQWSPTDPVLAILSSQGAVHMLNAKTRKPLWLAAPRLPQATSVAWTPDGKFLLIGCTDKTVRAVELEKGAVIAIYRGHESAITALSCDPDGRYFCSSSHESSIRVWDLKAARLKYVLEGHSDKVLSLSFSADGHFLMSQSRDNTIRLWRCESWEPVGCINEKCIDPTPFRRIAFCPSKPKSTTFALLSEISNSVHVFDIDEDQLQSKTRFRSSIYYTNTKVVLVGDSGGGKTGLSLVLTNKPFKATESTHGRNVLIFDKQEISHPDGRRETREILLWDLAGQPGYRMTHQLHLDDVALALVVFDARNDVDVFGGVKHWARALRVSERLRQQCGQKLKKFLIAARADRGGPGASAERIESLIKELNFDGYFETSAKENWQIRELRLAIGEAINWELMPRVTWQQFFLKVKDFLLLQKSGGRLLCLQEELFQIFLQANPGTEVNDDLKAQFNTCLDRLGNQDLIRKLSFGRLILLKPEVLDAYASAIVLAARDEPDGTGSIAEEDLFSGKFKMSKDERLKNKDQERLLLLATAEELLRHEIALRETADDGAFFVFPSQLTRERPSTSTQKLTKAAMFEFKGPLQNIYATLAVRLSHCGFFEKDQMWKNAANFRARDGGLCGIYVREIEEAYGELIIFFGKDVAPQSRYIFQEYIHSHLARRAVSDSVIHRAVIVCQGCDFSITEQLVSMRKERGFDWVDCPVCGTRVSLIAREQKAWSHMQEVADLDHEADKVRDRLVSAVIVESKKEVNDFDVFLAHKSVDKPYIRRIADHLRERSLNPWLDKEQVPPGRWFQDIIQAAIPKVKAAAICIGTSGMGKWQALELRSFISQCVDRSIPVIPVLLPGVSEIPHDLPFLRELNYVRFKRNVDEPASLDELVWGITGVRT